jgi:hypothetical protein
MNHVILQKAFQNIVVFYNVVILNSLSWKDPHVSLDVDNEIVFEWWNKERKITIYIEEYKITFIKVWGENVHHDMKDGPIDFADDFLNLWKWLNES